MFEMHLRVVSPHRLACPRSIRADYVKGGVRKRSALGTLQAKWPVGAQYKTDLLCSSKTSKANLYCKGLPCVRATQEAKHTAPTEFQFRGSNG